ncbi:MAG: outer membrane beta-barrel protein [Planctomycetota bacterium]|jgi:hypothetical protein
MKKSLMLVVCFLFVVANSFAEPAEEQAWELGTEVSYIKYDEPNVMEEKGIMYGICGSYTCRYDSYMLRVEGKYSYGQVDYENSGTKDNIDDYIFEFRCLVGEGFSISETTTCTPYAGFGYRYLNDDLAGKTSTGANGYEREQEYFYSPVGIETVTELENGWSIGVTLEYDIFWNGGNESHFSDITPAYNDLEFDQDKGHGCRGSIKFQKKAEKLNFIIEPFLRYWHVKESDSDLLIATSTYYVEPKNTSTEYGIKFAAKF